MDFKVGDFVKIKNTDFCGYIKKINKSGICYISVNNKLVKIDMSNLEKVENIYKDNKVTVNYDHECVNCFIPELMIRHQTLEEAMYNLDNFVKEAIENSVKDIKIIHGRSGGILRKGVHDYLKANKNVVNFRLGSYYEGSYGVTIVKLK